MGRNMTKYKMGHDMREGKRRGKERITEERRGEERSGKERRGDMLSFVGLYWIEEEEKEKEKQGCTWTLDLYVGTEVQEQVQEESHNAMESDTK
jgi:hypothetical protein